MRFVKDPNRAVPAPVTRRGWDWIDWLLAAAAGAAAVMLLVALAWPTIVAFWYRPRAGVQVPQESVGPEGAVRLNYLLYLPSDFTNSKTWPLVVFLHGAGERGSDIKMVTRLGLPAMLAKGRQLPCIVASPQCPAEQRWVPGDILALIDHICGQYSVDESRIYLMGYSMGGFGTWMTAAVKPERFAAIVPIAGGGSPQDADRLMRLPIWAFHGGADKTVPLKSSQEMIEAVRAAGGAPKLTVYDGEGHGICDTVCADAKLWDWLLTQKPPASRAP